MWEAGLQGSYQQCSQDSASPVRDLLCRDEEQDCLEETQEQRARPRSESHLQRVRAGVREQGEAVRPHLPGPQLPGVQVRVVRRDVQEQEAPAGSQEGHAQGRIHWPRHTDIQA